MLRNGPRFGSVLVLGCVLFEDDALVYAEAIFILCEIISYLTIVIKYTVVTRNIESPTS